VFGGSTRTRMVDSHRKKSLPFAKSWVAQLGRKTSYECNNKSRDFKKFINGGNIYVNQFHFTRTDASAP